MKRRENMRRVTIRRKKRARARGTTDSNVLSAVTKMLTARIPVMGKQGLAKLEAECSAKSRKRLAAKRPISTGSPRALGGHAGYVAAMNDTLDMISQWAPR